jgi:serine/threonine-protein kinase PknK
MSSVHRALADWFASPTSGLPAEIAAAEVVYHSLLSGDLARAEVAFRATELDWREHPRVFSRRLLPLLEAKPSPSPSLLLFWAELALLAGEFQQTARAAARLLRQRPSPEVEARVRLLAADALLRLGRGPRAERVLAKLQGSSTDREWRARALQRRARARLQASDPLATESFAQEGLELTQDPGTARALRELCGLAASYLGRVAEAQATFSELLAELTPDASPRERSRLLAARAIAFFRAGQAPEALDDYREALEISDRHGLDDLLCVNSLNLGTAQQKLGDLGGALGSYERGLRVAHALGRESTELTLRVNLGNLLCEVGDFARAENELSALTSLATPAQRTRFLPLIALIRSEIAIERRDPTSAALELDKARHAFGELGLERELAEVDTCQAELEVLRGDLARATALAEAACAAALRLTAPDLRLRARAVIARTALARKEPDALRALESLSLEAEAAGERVLHARLTSELYQAELEAGAPGAALRGARAERLWNQLGAGLPEGLREVFWHDRRRAAVARRTHVQAPRLGSAEADSEALRKVLSLGRRVNSSLSLERVFEYAVDAAIDLTQAERGFLLLDEAGEPRVVAQRPLDQALAPPSRAIVTRVAQSEEAVLTTDAQADQRFESPGSIHSMKLKSVLCVPVLTPSERIGLLYVDSRVQRARFGQRERDLLAALADQIAVAVSNARLHRAVEQQREELAQQKRLVERLSRAKDRELSELRERVELQERTLGLRYDYSRIVGQGPAMRRVFEQLDRITDSSTWCREKAAPARSWSRAPCTKMVTVRVRPSSVSTAPRSRRTCWSRSSSGTCAERSREPTATSAA